MFKLIYAALILSFSFGITSSWADETYPQYSAGSEIRVRWEDWFGGDIFPRANAWTKGIEDHYLLVRVRAHADADFTENLWGHIAFEYAEIFHSNYLDNHLWYERDPHLHQLFLKYTRDSFSVTVGRQEIDFGSRLVAGMDQYFNNSFTFDLARIDFRNERWEIACLGGTEAFESFPVAQDRHMPVAAYYNTFSCDFAKFDHYVLYRKFPRCTIDMGAIPLHLVWVGGRATFALGDFEFDLEGVKLFNHRTGWATHGIVDWYVYPEHWLQPQLFASINVASGSRDFKPNYLPFSFARQTRRVSSPQAFFSNLIEYGGGVIIHPIKDHTSSLRAMVYDMRKYDAGGPIYSGGPTHVWWTPTSSCALGQYISLMFTYDCEEHDLLFTSYVAHHQIGKAIREFANTTNTTWFYAALEKNF